MTLRELINKLEEVSNGGQNDNKLVYSAFEWESGSFYQVKYVVIDYEDDITIVIE